MKTMETFRRIVLATDGSEEALAAVEETIELAVNSGATVHVLNVWNLETRHRHDAHDLKVHEEAERIVKETVNRLAANGILADETVFRTDNNHVAAAIAQTARQHAADLVVIGSRGLSEWKSLFDTSVSREVLAQVDCPVLIVRSRPGALGAIRRIVVAVAGGDDVEPCMRAAAAVACTHPSRVSIVHVMQSIYGVEGFAYIETEEEAEAVVASAHHQLEAWNVVADRVIIPSGPVAPAIARLAAEWNADLIVTGSSRMGSAGSLLLGSVSHDLLHRTDIPLLIAGRTS